MTTTAVRHAAEYQDVCQLAMLSVVGDNCSQGADLTVQGRLASGWGDDSVFLFDDRVLFQCYLGVAFSWLSILIAMALSLSL